MRQIKGILEPFYETGTEGVIWSVCEDDKTGWDGLHHLEDGDRLTVLDPNGEKVLWSGVINFDMEVGYQPYPFNPEYGQQVCLGYWVHGIQKGFQPDDWGRLFFNRKKKPNRAILVPKRR